MVRNPFQHIDLRVKNQGVALKFYSQLLPAVGFTTDEGGGSFHCFSTEGEPPFKPWFGFTEDPAHRPNANRIAFSAESRAEVDRVAAIALRAGAQNMSGPRDCPEYSATYYAAFFEDPSGNPLEICFL